MFKYEGKGLCSHTVFLPGAIYLIFDHRVGVLLACVVTKRPLRATDQTQKSPHLKVASPKIENPRLNIRKLPDQRTKDAKMYGCHGK